MSAKNFNFLRFTFVGTNLHVPALVTTRSQGFASLPSSPMHMASVSEVIAPVFAIFWTFPGIPRSFKSICCVLFLHYAKT